MVANRETTPSSRAILGRTIPGKARPNVLLFATAALLAVPLAWLFLLQPMQGEDTVAAAPLEGGPDPSPRVAVEHAPVVIADASAPRDEAPRTTDAGTLEGEISLTPAIAQDLTDFTVLLVEAVNTDAAGSPAATRLHKSFRYDRSQGSPRFLWSGIPFSALGYRVSVVVPDCNGSEQHVLLSRSKPVQRVVLSLFPARVCHVFLRDQDRGLMPNLEVHLLPVGDPPGRKSQRGVSDSYGKVEFERVLEGRYAVVVGNPAAPIVREEFRFGELQADDGSGIPRDTTQRYVTVPRGLPLTCQVVLPGGYGLADVKGEAIAIDTQQFKRYQAQSDSAGKLVFPYLQPGMYQVRFEKSGYLPQAERVTIKDGTPLDPLKIEMAPVDGLR